MRKAAFLAMAILLAASAVGATPAPRKPALARVARVAAPAARALATTSGTSLDISAPWADDLSAVDVKNRNTNAHGAIRLYDARGTLDRGEARAFMRIAGRDAAAPGDASEDDERLDLRLVQLVLRASYHFKGAAISIVSATRPGANGKHGSGEALDFALEGVKAPVLASYLRSLPRAGVGLYTNPKTQYVHLDVREHSYHWLDGSPPGVTWREQLLPDPKQAARDASYQPSSDLPELR